MTFPYRLLAVDVDGTLLNARQELPARNREALHLAHAAGCTICLCTGRCLTETRPVLDQIGLDLDYGVFVFGSIVTDLAAGRTMFRDCLAPDTADRLVRHFRRRDCPVLLMHDVEEAGIDYVFIQGRHLLDAYERWLSLTPCRTRRVADWRPGPHLPVRVGIIEDLAAIDATMTELRREFDPSTAKINSIYAPNYNLQVVECFAPAVNKWSGILRVARTLGIDGSDIVAVGDDINDLEMISQAGLGVAMGNAIEPIKAVAAHQVPGHNECGVAVLIEDLLAAKSRDDMGRRTPEGAGR